MRHRLRKILLISFLTLALFAGASAFPAYAAEVTQGASADTINAGESVTVTLCLDEDISDCTTFACALHYDGSLFTLRSGRNGVAESRMNHSSPFSGEGDDKYIIISFVDETAQGAAVNKGELYSFTFASPSDLSETRTGDFVLEALKSADTSFALINGTTGGGISVTVEPLGETGYTAALPEMTSAKVGDKIAVPVTLSQGTESDLSEYAAVHLELSYDSSHLRYLSCDDPSVTVNDENDTVTLIRYGASRPLGDILTMFEIVSPGQTEIKLNSAAADTDEYADRRDTPPAKVTNGTYTISVTESYPVTLPRQGFAGANTADYGKDYSFTADSGHYLIGEITVRCEGSVVPYTDNGDGSYTVHGEYVTGALVVSADTMLRTFAVGISGNAKDDVTADDEALPEEEFSFMVDKQSGYNYAVSVQISGKNVTPSVSGITYTIPGEEVTGDIAITVTKSANASGGGSSGSSGGSSSGSRTSTAGTGSSAGVSVTVSEYVKLTDARSVWLITASGASGSGKVCAYSGAPMYQLKSGWLWLVISAKDLADVEAEARSAVSIQSGTPAGVVSRRGDVNSSGVRDINDAILIHSLYNAQFNSLDSDTFMRLLEADLNGDGVLDMRDAAALMALIK